MATPSSRRTLTDWPRPFVQRTGLVVVGLTTASVVASSITSIVTATIVYPRPPTVAEINRIKRVQQEIVVDLTKPNARFTAAVSLAKLQQVETVKTATVIDDKDRILAHHSSARIGSLPTIRSEHIALVSGQTRLGTLIVDYQPLRQASDSFVRVLLLVGAGAMTYGICALQVDALLASLSASLRALRVRMDEASTGVYRQEGTLQPDLTGLRGPFEKLLAVHETESRRVQDTELRIVEIADQLLTPTQKINSLVFKLTSCQSQGENLRLSDEIREACNDLLKATSAAKELAAGKGFNGTLADVLAPTLAAWRQQMSDQIEIQSEFQETPPLTAGLRPSEVRFAFRTLLKALGATPGLQRMTITAWYNPDASTSHLSEGTFFVRVDLDSFIDAERLDHVVNLENEGASFSLVKRILQRFGGAMIAVVERGQRPALVITLPGAEREARSTSAV